MAANSAASTIDRYVIDFACSERMLVVELDGGQHPDQQDYDDARTNCLQAKGLPRAAFLEQ